MSTDKPRRTMREAMPKAFAFIEDLREAFGADEINAIVKVGLSGVPVFRAVEAGHEIGTPLPPEGRGVTAAQMVIEVPAAAAPAKGRR